MRSSLLKMLRGPLRGGFERRLLASAGLHATVLGILAAAGAHAALGQARARRDALVHIARPSAPAWPAEAVPRSESVERRPLDEIEPVEPQPTAAAVDLPAPRTPNEPELERLPDTERIWSALTHARLTRPSELEAAPKEALDGETAARPVRKESAAQAAPPATAAEGPTHGAHPVHAPAPAYPRASLRLGEEGTVLCRLHVALDGSVARVEVVESSGHRRLDDAAVAALRDWRFDPARAAGTAVAAVYPHRVVFRLDDPAR